MTRAGLRDMRLRLVADVSLSLDEQTALVEALERLVITVAGHADSNGDVSSDHHFAAIGRSSVVIVREARLS